MRIYDFIFIFHIEILFLIDHRSIYKIEIFIVKIVRVIKVKGNENNNKHLK